MQRVKAVFALLAVMIVMVASAAPAMADSWWDDCEWEWSWELAFWTGSGYYLVCDYSDDHSDDWVPEDSGSDWEPEDSGRDWYGGPH
jgi:hypothetical protein